VLFRGGLGRCLLQKLGDLVALAEHLAEHLAEDPPQVVRCHDHRAYGVSGEHPQVLQRMQVGRVFHSDHETSVLHAKWKHSVPAQKLLVHQTGRVGVDVFHTQLRKLEAKLPGQGFGEVRVADVAQGEEGPAHPLTLLSA
jgi:hypothetical protein